MATNRTEKPISNEIALQNAEALSNEEFDKGSVYVQCDNYTYVVVCNAVCKECRLHYNAIDGYGHTTGVVGKCSCGSTSFSY